MPQQSTIGRRALTALAAASLLTTAVATVTAAPASAAPAAHRSTAARSLAATHSTARLTRLAAQRKLVGFKHSGRQAVFVQLSGAGAAAVSTATLQRTKGTMATRRSAARTATLDRRAEVRRTADTVLGAAKRVDSKAAKLFQVGNAVPGLGLIADRAALTAIASRPDVVKISPIVPKRATNASAAQLTNVVKTWHDTGRLGTGVTIGVIDTGLDYTHSDFGGIGTAQSFTNAQKKSDSLLYDWYGNLPAAAKAKIAGGIDFVGDKYDADPSDDTYNPTPTPDPNPLGCDPHGTHVAGIAAGYGVNSDGSTFTGDYTTLDSNALYNMKVGPGMAPEAKLFPLKVFGCFGSTDVVIPALDATLDPNDDGNTSDHLDIVNLSLGSDYSTPDDPENAVVNAIAAGGVLPVISMGNGGDLTDIGGSPGNAVRSLAVASSVDEYQLRDGLTINAPASAVTATGGTAAGQNSAAYDYATSGDVLNKPVVTIPGANRDGCAPITQNLTGKAVWLYWDDDDATRRCGSAARGANAVAAHAAGVVLTSSLDVFGAGITGVEQIPMFQLPKTETDLLAASAAAGTLNVSFQGSLRNTIKSRTPGITDTLSSFSSRGTHGSIGVVKPDVAAPGDTIASAGLGTGSDPLVDSGTSMASPHTAGIAALVEETHPSWTSAQVKAAVMNTADHDIYVGTGQTGQIYGPERDGAGRVDADGAVTTTMLAYEKTTPGAVSASFGVVPAPAGTPTVTRTRTITVQNLSGSAHTASLSYVAAVTEPGVSYSVSPTSVTVPANGSTDVTLTMTVQTAQLAHSIDPTMASETLGVPRQYLSDASGRLIVTPASGPRLRVPVYGAAKPTSAMTATAGTSRITLSGRGFDQGGATTRWTSLVSAMSLDATSGRLPACTSRITEDCTQNTTATGGDVRYVGSGTVTGLNSKNKPSLANGFFYIGVSTYGENATIGNSTIPYADIDTNRDGQPDYEVYVQNFSGTDLLVANLVNLDSGDVVDVEPVNFEFGDVDTNVFDTNAFIIPVSLGAMGVKDTTKSFPISYDLGMNSFYAVNQNGDIDDVGPVKVDAVKSKVDLRVGAGDVPLYVDAPGSYIPAVVSKAGTRALVLHLHNATANRAQVVTLNPDRSKMGIWATKTIHRGAHAWVGGTLTDAVTHVPLKWGRVLLYGRTHGSSSYTYRTSAITNSKGQVTVEVRPSANTTYEWRFAGTPGHAATMSATKSVLVTK